MGHFAKKEEELRRILCKKRPRPGIVSGSWSFSGGGSAERPVGDEGRGGETEVVEEGGFEVGTIAVAHFLYLARRGTCHSQQTRSAFHYRFCRMPHIIRACGFESVERTFERSDTTTGIIKVEIHFVGACRSLFLRVLIFHVVEYRS